MENPPRTYITWWIQMFAPEEGLHRGLGLRRGLRTCTTAVVDPDDCTRARTSGRTYTTWWSQIIAPEASIATTNTSLSCMEIEKGNREWKQRMETDRITHHLSGCAAPHAHRQAMYLHHATRTTKHTLPSTIHAPPAK